VTTVPVPFSAKLAVAAELNTGLNSLTAVTVTAIAWFTVRVPSLAVTVRS
jgi:hypothetical protein